MKVVVDASAMGALLFRDAAGPFADRVRDTLIAADVLVPAHWQAEVTNLIWEAYRRRRIDPAELPIVGAGFSAIIAQIKVVPATAPGRTVTTAIDLRLTAHDSLYVLAAQDNGAAVTSDKALAWAALASGVETITP